MGDCTEHIKNQILEVKYDDEKIKEIAEVNQIKENETNGYNEKMKENGDDEKIKSNGDDEKIKKNGDDEKIKENGDDEKIKENGDHEKIKENGDEEKIKEKGDDEKIKENGVDEKIKENGDDEKIKENSDDDKIKEIGDYEKIKVNGDDEKIKENGDEEKIKEKGDDEKIKENGVDEKIKENGDDEKIKENSDDEKIKEIGDYEKIKKNGDNEKIKKNGDDEKIKENGDDEKIKKNGNDEKIKENGDDEKINDNGDHEKRKENDDDAKIKENYDSEILKEKHGNEEWSDDMCIRLAMEDNFPANVESLTIQKSIINRFLNFYLSGKVQKGLNPRDIVFAVIAIMPYSLDSEAFLFNNEEYSEAGTLFFLTPEDKLQTEIRHIMAKHEQNSFGNEMEQHETNYEQTDVPETSNNEVTVDESKPEINMDTDTPPKVFNDQENGATEKPPNNSDSVPKSSVDNKQSSEEDLVWYRKKSWNRGSKQTETSEKYGPVDNSAFCVSCNKLLDSWDADSAARIQLKHFFGVVALSLMRTIAKSREHVMKMFTSAFPNIIAGTNCRIHYSPPSKPCVKKTYKTLRKHERKTHIMFAKLIINSFYLNRKYNNLVRSDAIPNTGGIKNILHVTVLAHTADYGMDIISLLQQVASVINKSTFRRVFNLLLAEETAASWNKVNNFLNKYMCRSGYVPTCHWARIIDGEQFKYLSGENSYELAVVIAVFVEKLSDYDSVWNARWIKTRKNLETYKQLGLKMYKEYEKQTISDLKLMFTGFNIELDL